MDENEQTTARQAKLTALVAEGINPYPNDFKPEQRLEQIIASYGAITDPDQLAAARTKVAGRVMLLRNFGKLAFAQLQDENSRLQLALSRDTVGPEQFDRLLRRIEVGDIVGASGHLFRTKTGELTIRVETLQLLAKSLRPLPEKWHGLEDVETRYRMRYLDLIVNPAVRELFRIRSRIVSWIRSFMTAKGFLEVETPMMHPLAGGATARPFVTHHHALGVDLFLRIAPELYLKRLIVGGFERVFEINRNFRNEGLSVRHNPEFTMMEFYQAYADYRDLMEFTEELICGVVTEVAGGLQISHQGRQLDFTRPWARFTLAEALVHHAGAAPDRVNQPEHLAELAATHRVPLKPEWELGKVQLELFEALVEDKLLQPTFIIDYPVAVSPLARRSDRDPAITERFELFIGGWEVANAFSELNDPADQAERFRKQMEAKAGGDVEAMGYDADYIRALEFGMPPTAGEGVGIDRLVMLLTDSAAIRDVLLFPQMRPEGGRGGADPSPRTTPADSPAPVTTCPKGKGRG